LKFKCELKRCIVENMLIQSSIWAPIRQYLWEEKYQENLIDLGAGRSFLLKGTHIAVD